MTHNKLRCIVVDDSSLQRLSITKMVKDHPNLVLVAEHNNALDTKRELESSKVDLIFLDIEMPILSGFDLLDNLEEKPEYQDKLILKLLHTQKTVTVTQ